MENAKTAQAQIDGLIGEVSQLHAKLYDFSVQQETLDRDKAAAKKRVEEIYTLINGANVGAQAVHEKQAADAATAVVEAPVKEAEKLTD
jgi:hypothetical protein